MIPYRLTATSREAMASPSLSMEKGAYRMRAPRSRTNTLRPATRIARPSQGGFTACTALLIVFLATAALSSFATAYYLFTTRWDTRAVPFVLPSNADQETKAVHIDLNNPWLNATLTYPDDEKFLSYLPHSGYHNQRIAFENALVLARMLNRTLLVPPIHLASDPLPYGRFGVLSKHLSQRRCSRRLVFIPTPPECNPWTSLSWAWLLDLSQITSRQRLFFRPNMIPSWILDHFQIGEADVLTIADSHLYQYRFLDSNVNASSLKHNKFQETLQISQLARRPERLIQLGTLFGTSRLLLRKKDNIRIRGEIRKSMVFANPHLVQTADFIANDLGGRYLGVHIRLGDGEFKKNHQTNARQIWWNVVNGILKLGVNDTLALERRLWKVGMYSSPPKMANFTAIPLLPPPPVNGSPSPFCRGRKYTSAWLQPLNTPLFVSTDAVQPLKDPTIAFFLKTFPCTFFLSDFPHLTSFLGNLRNEADGVVLKAYLLPFLDAMVVGKAWAMVGTEGSTFSGFVRDVLWRTYHGLEIIQRG